MGFDLENSLEAFRFWKQYYWFESIKKDKTGSRLIKDRKIGIIQSRWYATFVLPLHILPLML